MFNFVDAIIAHCEQSLERLKNELTKEQSSLAISDETLQTGIIKSIEFLEENIEKNIMANSVIHRETLGLYLDLYFTVGSAYASSISNNNKGEESCLLGITNNSDIFDGKDHVFIEEKEYLFERIVLFFQVNNNKIKVHLGNLKDIYGKRDTRIDELFDNFALIF